VKVPPGGVIVGVAAVPGEGQKRRRLCHGAIAHAGGKGSGFQDGVVGQGQGRRIAGGRGNGIGAIDGVADGGAGGGAGQVTDWGAAKLDPPLGLMAAWRPSRRRRRWRRAAGTKFKSSDIPSGALRAGDTAKVRSEPVAESGVPLSMAGLPETRWKSPAPGLAAIPEVPGWTMEWLPSVKPSPRAPGDCSRYQCSAGSADRAPIVEHQIISQDGAIIEIGETHAPRVAP